MNVTFIPVKQEVEELVQFLTSEIWPYHGVEKPVAADIRKAYDNGAYHHENTRTFWIALEGGHQKIGLIRLFDVNDPNVMFDLRIRCDYRGKGIGVAALRWIVTHVFSEFPEAIRVEGHTRVDNEAMRALFAKSTFVLEAYHRKAWRQAGQLFDSVGYGVTREDWENNKITPIPWSTTEHFGGLLVNPILNQIGGAFIPVSDVEKARNWYCDILGLPADGEILFGHIYVLPMEGPDIVLDSKIYAPDKIYKVPVFQLRTTDIHQAYEYMRAKNVQLTTEIENDHWFNFKDPDGNLLMVCK